jgi:phosphoribosylaminoimidazole-succinocarboxamide synthase
MPEREALARDNLLPAAVLMRVSQTYLSIAEKVVGHALTLSANPKAEIIAILRDKYGLVD